MAPVTQTEHAELDAAAHKLQEAVRAEEGAVDALKRAAPEHRIQKAAALSIRRGMVNLAMSHFDVCAHGAGILEPGAADAGEVARHEARGDGES